MLTCFVNKSEACVHDESLMGAKFGFLLALKSANISPTIGNIFHLSY